MENQGGGDKLTKITKNVVVPIHGASDPESDGNNKKINK
jgi:hypothetical protein